MVAVGIYHVFLIHFGLKVLTQDWYNSFLACYHLYTLKCLKKGKIIAKGFQKHESLSERMKGKGQNIIQKFYFEIYSPLLRVH